MSARDDFPFRLDKSWFAEMADEIDRLRAQNDGLANIGLRLTETIDRMQKWKTEALQVLGEWERVWEAAGRPGTLGSSKADSVRALFTPDEAMLESATRIISENRRPSLAADALAAAGLLRAPDEVNEAQP